MPPGHFYSPLPDADEVRARADRIFAKPETLPGVDVNEAGQLALIAELARYAPDASLARNPTPERRYYSENDNFGYGDAIVLQALLRQLRPARLVEIGSGYSSAVMLDTNERFLDGSLACTFVEPYPDRLQALLREDDLKRATLIQAPVQDVPLEPFLALEAGDVLFVDSSHVAKTGSDVNHIFFELVPRLAPGVFVHVHDIFWPFEYPDEWVYEGRAWNEAYLLRAFLEHNAAWEIALFSSWLATFHAGAFAALVPPGDQDKPGGIWLQRR